MQRIKELSGKNSLNARLTQYPSTLTENPSKNKHKTAYFFKRNLANISIINQYRNCSPQSEFATFCRKYYIYLVAERLSIKNRELGPDVVSYSRRGGARVAPGAKSNVLEGGG